MDARQKAFLIASILGVSGTKPNFLIIIADDLGYGDLGAFGNTTLPTPNIDRLASQGVKLTHHLAAASVCTPSRAALLTARYPVRYGLAAYGRSRVLLFIASTGGLPNTEVTFAKLLQKENYSTALIGKWHLGTFCDDKVCHHPLRHGFDYFYGLPLTNLKDFGHDGASVVLSNCPLFYYWVSTAACVSLTCAFMLYKLTNWKKLSVIWGAISVIVPALLVLFQRNIFIINSVLMKNMDVIEQPILMESLTQRIVDQSIGFISSQAKNEKPFALVLAFSKVHSAHFPSVSFKGKSAHGLYGDCVMELDWAIGQVLMHLDQLGIRNNTFVYFTSDNGGHIEELGSAGDLQGGYNGPFPGGKGQGAVEGGIRIPGIIRWSGIQTTNSVIDVPTSQMDLFPTILDIVGIPVPDDRQIDGRSLLPLLKSSKALAPHKFLFHYCGAYLGGVRYFENPDHIWKIYFITPQYADPASYKCGFICQCFDGFVVHHDPPLLYNLAQDPGEKIPLNASSTLTTSGENLVSVILNAVSEHKQTMTSPVESQLDFLNTVWRPLLQPCCNFPFCSCRENLSDASVVHEDSLQH